MDKKILSILVALFISAFLSASPALADTTLDGLNNTARQVGAFNSTMDQARSDSFIQTRVGTLIGTALSFVGVIFLILIIYAGILWMTASGNDQQVTKAKNMLINSIIGIIIVFAAYAITNFIGDFVSNQMLK
jgi:cbb3-type cytochrome oxidase subunit 3